jgi:hypothetical protein
MKNKVIGLSGLWLLLACVVTTSCKSNQPSASSGMFSSPAARTTSESAANDYTKPYLTDEKMAKLLASMKEEHNPFEFIFKDNSPANLLTMGSRLEEFNSFARKYGFQDYQDYTAVWGRVMAGEIQLWGEQMMKESTKTFQKTIDDAQVDLKKPNLSPEQRKFDEEQIAGAQKTIDDMNQSNDKSGLNAEDLELVKKYKDQVDEAQKKYKTGR